MSLTRRDLLFAAGGAVAGAATLRGATLLYRELNPGEPAQAADFSARVAEQIASHQQAPVRPLRAAMVGDSQTSLVSWGDRLGLEGIGNFGVAWAQTRELMPLVDRIAKATPTRVFLQAGINDLLRGRSVADTVRDIGALVNALRRVAPLTLTSIFPVGQGYGAETLAADIAAVNQQIRALPQISFINLHARLRDDQGWLKPEFTIDRLHINGVASRLWVEEVGKRLIA